ncbi:MAG: SDR family NAD(P)-dependent oxidoreductase [Pseudomonadota bacterium]
MQRLIGALLFYLRFLPSFTAPPFHVRKRRWRAIPSLEGQTWLITGASDGIGRALGRLALEHGAHVVGVARNRAALDDVPTTPEQAARFTALSYDLSSMSAVESLSHALTQSKQLDVLVNNVGVMLHEPIATSEGFEASFATNLLGHYLLTRTLRDKHRLATGARVINMSSGGMYNVPLLSDRLDTLDDHDGLMAYALHKRAQVILTDYWREHDAGRHYYVMHPGWVNTQGVKTSLPRFHAVLGRILRTPAQGADTALWLGATTPEQSEPGIWFDRALRNAHIYSMTKRLSASGAHLVSLLDSKLASLSDR